MKINSCSQEKSEVIKVEIPKSLAERFRKYVAEKYGFRRGALSKAIADLIEKELNPSKPQSNNTINEIVSIGLQSNYKWKGEDLIKALRRRANAPNRR